MVKAKVNQITKKMERQHRMTKKWLKYCVKHSKRCLLQKIESRTTAKQMRLGKMMGEEEGNALVDFSIDNIRKKLEELLPDNHLDLTKFTPCC